MEFLWISPGTTSHDMLLSTLVGVVGGMTKAVCELADVDPRARRVTSRGGPHIRRIEHLTTRNTTGTRDNREPTQLMASVVVVIWLGLLAGWSGC